MDDKPSLGRLEHVDLRSYWEREDTDFTPWLAQEENLQLLGETIGMELELEETEANVGPFRADILCRESNSDAYVLIENQLEQTDHTHLGQLMTYSAGLDAVNILWIAQRFTDEHRAALDWLNRITMEDFHFFGIEVELYRIGDSAPAPRFNMVAKPNDWTKAVQAQRQPIRSDRAAMYRQLWSEMLDSLREHHPELKLPNTTGRQWIRISLGDIKAVLSYAPTKSQMSMYLLFRGPEREKWYQAVEADSDAFEEEVGQTFSWNVSENGGWANQVFEFNHFRKDESPDLFSRIGEIISRMKVAVAKRQDEFRANLEAEMAEANE